jgi:serpin B
LLVAGCFSPSSPFSTGTRPSPADAQVDPADLEAVVAGNSDFAFDLFHQLGREDGNLVFSPYGITQVLAMTHAGAAGSTAQQIAEVLHLGLPQVRRHAARGGLARVLDSRNRTEVDAATGEETISVQMEVANAPWVQRGFRIKRPYVEALHRRYDTDVKLLDFEMAPESARKAINDWVRRETREKIKEAAPAGIINQATRLVLANAVYLDAVWQFPFEVLSTTDAPFFLLDGDQIEVQMMRQSMDFRYMAGVGFQAIDLHYEGGELSMLIVVPDRGNLVEFVSSFDTARFDRIRGALAPETVWLMLPRFEIKSDLPLSRQLHAMGMLDAFGPEAGLSGITNEALFISEVLHKAYLRANESGTEAAAVTLEIGESGIPTEPVELSVDRPFLFLVYDRDTGTILFMGRVLDPTDERE